MTSEREPDTQGKRIHIVIVGAGIVGCTQAALLSQLTSSAAITITLLDRDPPPSKFSNNDQAKVEFDPRVVSLSLASEQILRRLGVWQYLQEQRYCAYQAIDTWDHEGTGQVHFNADIQQLVGEDTQHMGTIVENSVLIRALLTYLGDTKPPSSALTVKHGVNLQSLHPMDYGVEVAFTDTDDKIGRITADLVIAADGANSLVRQQAGIKVKKRPYDQQAIVATVKTEQAHGAEAKQSFLSSGPLAFLPLPSPTKANNEHYSSIVWSLDDELAATTMALSQEAFNQQLSQLMAERVGRVEVCGKRYCFPLVERHAYKYFAGKVALIGDAAHTIHPLAGQGVNLGIADAECLAKELERALARGFSVGDESVLRRYERQRKHKTLEMMLMMQGFKALFGRKTPAVRILRNIGLNLVDQTPPLKHWFSQRASGL